MKNTIISKSKKFFCQLPSFKFSTFNVYNPITNQICYKYEKEDKEKQMERKLTQMRNYRMEWQNLELELKRSKIRNFISEFRNYKEELVRTLCETTGKNLAESSQEIQLCFEMLDKDIEGIHDLKITNNYGYYTLEPFENILVTYDHRMPAISSVKYLICSLLAGASLTLKPKRYALPITKILQHTWNKCNPQHPLIYVPVNPYASSLQYLAAHNETGFLSFSGDVEEGNKFYHYMATKNEIFAESQFLLSSSDSAYITKNLTHDELVQATKLVAKGCFSNNGNYFCSIKKVFIDSRKQHEFLNLLMEQSAKYRIGKALNSPLITVPHIQEAQKQIQQLSALKEDGLERLTEINTKKEGRALRVDPIIYKVDGITSYQYENKLFHLSIVFVEGVESHNEAVEKMNNCIFGVTGSIFSNQPQQIEEIGRRLEVGVVNGNSWGISAGMPVSPRKRSGKGFSFSVESLSNVIRTKSIYYRKPKPIIK